MQNRPKIKIGDIVKLSKKGKNYRRRFDKSTTLIVSEVSGDGIDHSSIVSCRLKIDGNFQYIRLIIMAQLI